MPDTNVACFVAKAVVVAELTGLSVSAVLFTLFNPVVTLDVVAAKIETAFEIEVCCAPTATRSAVVETVKSDTADSIVIMLPTGHISDKQRLRVY
jgi:hypothetical protein